MKKIAIVNQRYGLEVNGGSEYYTRLIAERLNKFYDVEILTTTALNYDTWENHYAEGVSEIHGVSVRRFKVRKQRTRLGFGVANRLQMCGARFGFKFDKLWVKKQGPFSPDLVKYIEAHAGEYEKIIFVTYLYYSTVIGIQNVLQRAILIPTAHDEPYIYFDIYKKMFQEVSGIVYLTEEEKQFVHRIFKNENIPNVTAAVGIDIPEQVSNLDEQKQFREKHQIAGDYIIYAGRVDASKGCDQMLEFFQRYKEKHASELQLVILGRSMLTIPENHDIHYLGFVSEEEKMTAIAGAKYLWLPSKFESLSIALLEGLAQGVPGIVNGNCEVLKGHADRSQAAFYYRDWDEFERCMMDIHDMNEAQYHTMSENAVKYVNNNYCWGIIEQKLKEMIER